MVSLYSSEQVNMALSPSTYCIVNGSENENKTKSNFTLSKRFLFNESTAQLGIMYRCSG
jgi:hypothetical protein